MLLPGYSLITRGGRTWMPGTSREADRSTQLTRKPTSRCAVFHVFSAGGKQTIAEPTVPFQVQKEQEANANDLTYTVYTTGMHLLFVWRPSDQQYQYVPHVFRHDHAVQSPVPSSVPLVLGAMHVSSARHSGPTSGFDWTGPRSIFCNARPSLKIQSCFRIKAI